MQDLKYPTLLSATIYTGAAIKQVTCLLLTIDRHILSLTDSVDASRDVCGTPDEILTSTESAETTAEPTTTETAGIEDNNGTSPSLSFTQITLYCIG